MNIFNKFKRIMFVCALICTGGFAFAQELSIDYRYNLAREDAENYLSFRSPNRFIMVDKDKYDAKTGASAKKATPLFGAVYIDMGGKTAFPDGLRGVLLFPVAPPVTITEDNFNAVKAAGGEITLQYAHRGVAYRIVTGKDGAVSLPRGRFQSRAIGYIEGHDPQVISRDFSSDGTAETIDWKKVWDPKTPSGQVINPAVSAKTGPIQNDFGNLTAMFNWDGVLTCTLENDILKITGKLKAVKR